jgi:transposase
MTRTHINNPMWHDDVTAAQKVLVTAVGLDWRCFPKHYFFGPEAPKPVIAAPTVSISDVSDVEWKLLRKLLPKSKRKNAMDLRNLLSALAYKKASGIRFVSIPARFGSAGSLRKQAERLALLGTWGDLLEALPTLELDPARRQLFSGIAREWASVGVRLLKARGIEPRAPADSQRKPKGKIPAATAAWMKA